MYGRIYVVRVTPTAVGEARDFLELSPASQKPLIIHKVVISPTASETNQQVQVTIRILPATVTSGSGGHTPSTNKTNTNDADAAFTAEAMNTTRATTSGTAQYQADEGFPSQGGFEYLPDVLHRPIVHNGQAFVVGIEESVGSAVMGGYAVVEEL